MTPLDRAPSCVGCGKPTLSSISTGQPVDGLLARPCCGSCAATLFAVLPRLADARRTFGDFLPDPEIAKRRPQMVKP